MRYIGIYIIIAGLFLFGTFGISQTVLAEQVELEAEKDNTIFEEDEDRSCGACESIFVGTTAVGDYIRRGLVEFNVTSIPQNATVTNVEFEFVVSKLKDSEDDTIMEIHKVNVEWGEADSTASGGGPGEGSGGVAEPGDATWTDAIFDDTVNWTTPGGDFEASPSVSITLPSNLGTFTTTSTASMVVDVQSWVNGSSTNHGWILKYNSAKEDSFSNARAIESRDDGSGTPPILRVNYTIPDPDSDMDGIPDSSDNCPSTANPGQEDNYGTSAGDACEDTDTDTVLDDTDNCPEISNPGQEDNYGTSVGDACEDTDVDTVLDDTDNCPTISNLDQYDIDNDGTGDKCDINTIVSSSIVIDDCHEFAGDVSVTGGFLMNFTANGKAILPSGSSFSVSSLSGAYLTNGSSIHISNSVFC